MVASPKFTGVLFSKLTIKALSSRKNNRPVCYFCKKGLNRSPLAKCFPWLQGPSGADDSPVKEFIIELHDFWQLVVLGKSGAGDGGLEMGDQQGSHKRERFAELILL
ncbi:UNVERIFIED_CONTAM: hypothetical protein K2H54_017063 [Gekko kuhli]